MTKNGTDKRKGRQSGSTRDNILEAARKVLVKKGNSASLSAVDVCAAARYTRPTFYQYFGGKRELLAAIHRATMERDLKPYYEKARSIDDPEDRLRFMVRTYMKDIICVYPELRVLIHDSLNSRDKYFQDVKTEWRKHYRLLTSTIEEIKKKGLIRGDINASWAALFMMGMLTWTTYWFDFKRKANVDEITDLAEALVFNALGLTPCKKE